ncbi:MAG: hypothetical protein ROR55_27070 [Devosia sp.]
MTATATVFSDGAEGKNKAFSDAEILEGLERILNDPDFQSSPRRREMLRYIVHEKVAGRADRLKGISIAHAVFMRGEDFDQQTDPVVRIEARRLRRDLDSYYAGKGTQEPLRITIPKGAYVPFFEVLPSRPALATTNPAAQTDLPDDDQGDQIHEAVQQGIAATPRRSVINQRSAFGAAVLVALLLVGAWVWAGVGGHSTPVQKAVAAVEAEPPGLIVLPFRPLSDAKDDAFLAEGITYELITNLMKFPGFRLFSVPASFAADQTSGPVDLGERYGIQYVAQGTLRSMADSDEVRLSVQMVSAQSGLVIWSETFEHVLTAGSLMHTQSEIAARLANLLGAPYGVITEDIRARLIGKTIPSNTTYACVMRAYSYRRTFAKTLFQPVVDCLDRAIQTDPDYAEAWAMRAWLYNDAARYNYVPEEEVQGSYLDGLEAASEALELDPSNVLALKAISSIQHHMGHYAEGERFARRALQINPNDPDTLAQLGWRLAVRGHFDQGIPYLERAIARTISAPPWYYALPAINDLMNARADDMLTNARKFARGGSPIAHALLAIAEARVGDQTAARAALKVMETDPHLAADPAKVFRSYGTTDDITATIMTGLRDAGWTPPAHL